MIQLFLLLLVFIYLLSATAVYIWHKYTVGTSQMSWVGREEIFFPIYNTITAIALWSDYNPLNKK